MTASAGAWYRVGTVNVTSGQQAIVGVGTNWQNDVIAIAIGDIFTVDSKTWYEVTAVNSDTSITLDRNFEAATAAGANYAIVRNTSGTILTRIAGQVSVQFNQKQLFLDELRTWLNSDNPSEELTDSHGVKQELKTPAQMVRDHDDKLAELDEIHPFPWAMRKVEFEARRAANNEKFAAGGFVHFGKVNSSWEFVSEGLGSVSSLPNQIRIGRSTEAGKVGDSKTDYSSLVVAGVVTNLISIGEHHDVNTIIKLPPAEDGTRTYDTATGIPVVHATPAIAFASETETNEVVTDRIDMWGFEAFLREINDADPFVYQNGLIQSLATKINGVTTVTDNVRPDSYFAWYKGDDSSTGKGVNWQTATEVQRIDIASDPENNIYFDDKTGKFYQWCIRGRSFTGAGNGDWNAIDTSTGSSANYLFFDSKYRPEVQGIADSASTLGEVGPLTYGTGIATGISLNSKPDIAIYTGRHQDRAVNGECYFLVCGTVERLNKGGYHPSFNPLGACMLEDSGTGLGRLWYNTDTKPLTTEECFTLVSKNAGNLNTGSIATGLSGRPDGRYFDAIYASGQGGVCRDMRYSAWGLTQEDFAARDLAVKSGNYRGRELLKFTSIKTSPQQTVAVSEGIVVSNVDSYSLGDYIALIHPTDGVVFQGTITRINPAVNGVYLDNVGTYSRKASTYYIAHSSQLKTSIAGEYTHTEVIGDPANILLCDDLKGGWVGRWNPTIPDGTSKAVKGTVPCIDHLITFSTADNGENWALTSPVNFENQANSHTAAFTANAIWMVVYKPKAVMTKNSVNSKVYGGKTGVADVFASSQYADNRGQGLGFSLTGNINTNSLYAPELGQKPISSPYLFDVILFDSKINGLFIPGHSSLSLGLPNNNSPAFKALNYNVVENQQGFINYAYTELKHNGTDWGDDGKIHIVDNQTTMLDENGKTVLVGTARCVEPLGWIKNDK